VQNRSVNAMDTHLVRVHRAKLEHRLSLAERHVQMGESQLAKQREHVAQLERSGYETKTADAMLKQFEELQKLHLADLEKLRNELALWDEAGSMDHPLAPT
jgi:hypothetical protein